MKLIPFLYGALCGGALMSCLLLLLIGAEQRREEDRLIRTTVMLVRAFLYRALEEYRHVDAIIPDPDTPEPDKDRPWHMPGSIPGTGDYLKGKISGIEECLWIIDDRILKRKEKTK